uniref:Reverse transcriptase zinc-binding domain-containing protein n=1 Tax=Triticum urartu TaxID=4572 RepID=A0A8R7PY34_TRIUA
MKPLCRLSDEPVQLVSDLIIEASGEWDVELVRKMFIAPDAAAILKMPRPRVQVTDFWAWAWEQLGAFTVHSAYKMLLGQKAATQVIPSSSSHGEDWWRALWKLQVQPKIRIFWWRVLKKFVPVHGEMMRRHIREDAICPMCGSDDESLFHVLVQCDHAILFWEEAQDFFRFKLPRLHPVTWSRDILDHSFMAKESAAITVSVMWAIWT